MSGIERVLAAVVLAGAVAGAAAIPRFLVGPGGAPGVLLAPDAGGARTIVHAAPAPLRPVRPLLLRRTVVPAHIAFAPAAAVAPAGVTRQHKTHAAATPHAARTAHVAETPVQPQAAAPVPAAAPVASPPPAAPVAAPAPSQPAPAPAPPPVRVTAAVKVDHGLHRGRDNGNDGNNGKGHDHPAPPPAPDPSPVQPAVSGDAPSAQPAAPEPGDRGKGHDGSARMDAWHGSGDSAQAPSASPSPPGTSGGDSHHGRGGK